MSGWGGGYVTDSAYVPAYFKMQSPATLMLACRLNGVVCDLAADSEEVAYLELGCGLGYTALAIAAANPSWRVTAVDFNPAHVAFARGFALRAGLANIRILEADLATLAEDTAAAGIPEADMVSLHGVWSWVGPEVRSGILRLLKAKLRPGGMVGISYNALPAWQEALALQRVLAEAGRRLAVRSDRQARAGFEFVRALRTAGARAVPAGGMVGRLIEAKDGYADEYLAHEFMNRHWQPFFHLDVAQAMAEAKLDYVGGLRPLDNFLELQLTEAQRKLAEQFEDPLMRELVKDTCAGAGLRQDLYVRGPLRTGPAGRDAALAGTWLALTGAPESFRFSLMTPAGEANLSPDFYTPILARLAAGPATVGELVALARVEGRPDNPAELVGVLVGSDQALTVLRPGAPAGAAAERFNREAAAQFGGLQAAPLAMGLASAALGGAMPSSRFDLLLWRALSRQPGGADIGAIATAIGGAQMSAEQRSAIEEAVAQTLALRAGAWAAAGLLAEPIAKHPVSGRDGVVVVSAG